MKFLIPIAFIIFLFCPKANAQLFDWANGVGGSKNDVARDICTDNVGDVITVGSFRGWVDFDPSLGEEDRYGADIDHIFVVKYDADGNLIWVVTPTADEDSFAYSVTTDDENNVYLTGDFKGTVDFDPGPGEYELTAEGDNAQGFILKLSSSGEFIWAKKIENLEDYLRLLKITTDRSNNVLITGEFKGSTDLNPGVGEHIITAGEESFIDLFILKLDNAGNFLWGKQVKRTISGGTGTSTDRHTLTVDSDNEVYWGFSYKGIVYPDDTDLDFSVETIGLGTDIYILKFDIDGAFVWIKEMVGTDSERLGDMTINSDDELIMTGSYKGSIDFDTGPGSELYSGGVNGRPFTLKMTRDGDFLWVYSPEEGAEYLNGRGVDIDERGNVYATGVFRGTMDVDPSDEEYLLNSDDLETYVYKLKKNGELVWAVQIGGNIPQGIAVFNEMSIYTAGLFKGIHDFDHTAEVFELEGDDEDGSFYDFFVHKIGDLDYTNLTEYQNNNGVLYPNPTQNAFQLNFQEDNNIELVKILDQHGRVIYQYENPEFNQSYYMTECENGMYFVEMHYDYGKTNVEKLIVNR